MMSSGDVDILPLISSLDLLALPSRGVRNRDLARSLRTFRPPVLTAASPSWLSAH